MTYMQKLAEVREQTRPEREARRARKEAKRAGREVEKHVDGAIREVEEVGRGVMFACFLLTQ